MGGADRRREAGLGAQSIAAGDEGEIVGAAAQLVDEVGDQIVEPAVFADQADQRLARDGLAEAKIGGFDPQHPFAPAGGRRQVGELDVESSSALPSAAARSGGHRPYSRNVGRPGELARGAKRDQPVEQPPGGAVGHRRLARRLGRGDAILGEQQVDDFGGRFGAQFGRDGDQGVRSGGKDRRRGRGRRRRRGRSLRRRCSTRRGRRASAAAAPPDLRAGSRIFVAISGSGRGQRSRMARTRSNIQRARISASAAGASGKAENARAAAFAAAGDRIALPCRKPSGWTLGRSGPAEPGRAAPPRRRAGLGRGWAGGRRGRATA